MKVFFGSYRRYIGYRRQHGLREGRDIVWAGHPKSLLGRHTRLEAVHYDDIVWPATFVESFREVIRSQALYTVDVD